jgi:hypothetical protein
MLKSLIFLTAFSQIFLNRFGIGITSEFSLAPSYLFLYASIAMALHKGFIRLDPTSCLIFAGIIFSSLTSYLLSAVEVTFTSLILYWFIYLPFAFRATTPTCPDIGLYRLYYPLLLVLALAGLGQFLGQFFFSADWLFDYRPLLPDSIQNKNNMNTVISYGSIFKSNGFFLLEPSYFSQWMAYSILLFCIFSSSYLCGLLFFLGLLASMSGTGLILLGVSFLVLARKMNRARASLMVAAAVVFVLISFLTGGSSYLSRISEFSGGAGVRTTSAAARFVNPAIIVSEGLTKSPELLFFGNGPGAINRMGRDYDSHDPTWAKLLYEYGLIGFLLLLAFISFSTRSEHASSVFTLPFLLQWLLLGGHLLTLDVVVLYVLYYKFFYTNMFSDRGVTLSTCRK